MGLQLMHSTTPTIDRYFPYRGPCILCGGPDARHRLFDALWGFYQAGDSVEVLADEYEYPVKVIGAVIEWMEEGDSENAPGHPQR